jgi:hypothetical protein
MGHNSDLFNGQVCKLPLLSELWQVANLSTINLIAPNQL